MEYWSDIIMNDREEWYGGLDRWMTWKIGYGRLVKYNYDRVEWYGGLDRWMAWKTGIED